MLTVATPGTLRVAQTRGRPKSPPEQETLCLVVETTDGTATAIFVGALVTPADTDALRLATLDTPAPAEAVATPPLEGRTPAFKVTAPRLPRPTVIQALSAAPEHDEEIAVIVLSLITVLVGTTAGAVIVGTDAPREAPPERVANPPLVGRTPAFNVTAPKSPRPKVMQASTAAPVHDVETAVIVLPEIVSGVARTAGAVIATEAPGKVALAPALTRPPSLGRTPAPSVIVAISPRPKVMHASTAAPVHDVETAVIVLPEIVSGVGKTAGTVRAADATGREALTPALTRPPSVGSTLAPSVTEPNGPRPRLIQTLARPLPVHD